MPPRISPDQIPASPDLSLENALWDSGIIYIAGIDEAGRGALAGPVTAAAVILPSDPSLINSLVGVRDSKKMTARKRTLWVNHLQEVSIAWSVGLASQFEIDSMGILPATRLAATRALETLPTQPNHILLDYLLLPDASQPQTSLIKGDARSLSIAAASIFAKTTRDALLCELNARYPGYGFQRHKGYGTKTHISALNNLGPSPAHRLTFSPVAEICNKQERPHERFI
jgi:ribonuclease HII